MTEKPDQPVSLVVLGAGYTGRRIYQLRRSQSLSVTVTSRDPNHHLAFADPAQRLRFDLARRNTWANLPTDAAILWCFPPEPLDVVAAFSTAAALSNRRLVVLGSTSAYAPPASNEYPPPWVDETSPIDLSKARVQGEEHLRKECGAIVLRVAGIYGPGRNPLDWIRSGRVGPSRKYVNLIHVEDLAAICLAALARGTPGEPYNVSDGTPRTWESICHFAQQRWGIAPQQEGTEGPTGKRISITKLRNELGYHFRHPELFAALAQLSAIEETGLSDFGG